MTDTSEALQLLADGGVLDNLKAAAQDAKELERAELLEKLAQFEQAEAKRCAALGALRPGLLQKIAELEAALAASKRELAGLDTGTPATGDKLRGKLRTLSDPRIAQTIDQLIDLDAKARGAFRGSEQRVRLLTGGHATENVSNSLEIGDCLAAITGSLRELEALRETARPDDLAVLLAEKIDPIKVQVRKLCGFS